jgi:hypothetical protein
MMRLKITSQVHVLLWLLALGLMPGHPLSPEAVWAADTDSYADGFLREQGSHPLWPTQKQIDSVGVQC